MQVARRQADKQWQALLSHWDESLRHDARWGRVLEWFPWGTPLAPYVGQTETLGGNVFRAWRQSKLECQWFTLVLRQEQSFFGNNIEGELSRGVVGAPGVRIRASRGVFEHTPALVDAVRIFLGEVSVELVLEP